MTNPSLDLLHPYPFQKLRQLLQGLQPNPTLRPINLSIGEPKHATPEIITQAISHNMAGLAEYPTTQGQDGLRRSIGQWLQRRYGLTQLDWASQVLPVNGSREALFAFAQAMIDRQQPDAVVLMPNPFYQIYEGAALLAGAQPYYLNTWAAQGHQPQWQNIPREVLARTQLLYVCSPGNPSGAVMQLDDWRTVFALADEYGFIIASDECYSELYFDEAHPPLGALQAAEQLGRNDYRQLVIFSSLSKRSNVPGLRSGFVAGDARLLEKFLLYRTYHGSAMSPMVQAASAVAWADETHVQTNRQLYREKFAQVQPLLAQALPATMPEASFYLWVPTPMADTALAQKLYAEQAVTVLPGSLLARQAHGENPGQNHVRIALVAPLADCVEAAQRIVQALA